ncbi:low molecular weight protein-tyrosine-phosphatase [Halomonas salinarum]|uniref:low molecular weight protein-tyrosine-phosphatase n=1 Tax=Halomonas salinarum TaxID=1158993 RepID=UPI001439E9F3|nr:low molecular weight protein-tyrosine-phosphatase [Halomonas salinarum]
MFDRILVVCIGNICRSPVAEALLKQQFPHKQISSAGLGARVGEGVDPNARHLGEADGLHLADHQARQLTADMLNEVDLVLVMSDGQRRAVGDISPAALGKTMRIGRWLGDSGEDIPDPYRKSPEIFELVHRKLTQATATWANKL